MSLLQMTYLLEKRDVYHREEMNLRLYREVWVREGGYNTFGDFFDWLDYGEGKYKNLRACPREQLDRECVTYVPNGQRKPYRVVFSNGRFVYKSNGRVVNTRSHEDTIYVLSPKWKFYVHEKINMVFHHSSFMSGGPVFCAGHLHVNNGILMSISFISGHYRPTFENFQLVQQFLQDQNVNLSHVRMMW